MFFKVKISWKAEEEEDEEEKSFLAQQEAHNGSWKDKSFVCEDDVMNAERLLSLATFFRLC